MNRLKALGGRLYNYLGAPLKIKDQNVQSSLKIYGFNHGAIYLDDSTQFEITGSSPEITLKRWAHISHCDDQRYSIILLAGEKLTFNSSLL